MNLISDLLKKHSDTLELKLSKEGISNDLAKRLLSEIESDISNAIKMISLEKTNETFLSGDASQLLTVINSNTIASTLDITTAHVNTGLKVIAPDIAQIFKHNSREIIEYAASLSFKSF